MDWLSRRDNFVDTDLKRFDFHPKHPLFEIQTIKIHVDSDDRCHFEEPSPITSEPDYRNWLDQCRISDEPHQPTILLAMHKRLKGDCMKAESLPYGKETLQHACRQLFQHRSLALMLPRTSVAVINSRFVTWGGSDSWGRSIVYTCKSDTESRAADSDVIMNVTLFIDVPLTYVVIYGCTSDTIEDIASRLDRFKRSAFHPLMFPMMFVELERERLLDMLHEKGPNLVQRVNDMEKRLKSGVRNETMSEIEDKRPTIMQNDCLATKSWVSVSALKNGMESLVAVLRTISAQPKLLVENEPSLLHVMNRHADATKKIQSRLKDIELELQSKTRTCDGLLGGMALATQMEWNYHTRLDSKANIIIAIASKRDSTQMKYISTMGMIFLPGTFLATLFSMGFFNWIPDRSNDVVSPWIAIYGVLTLILTGGTICWWRKWDTDQKRNTKERMDKLFDGDVDSINFFV